MPREAPFEDLISLHYVLLHISRGGFFPSLSLSLPAAAIESWSKKEGGRSQRRSKKEASQIKRRKFFRKGEKEKRCTRIGLLLIPIMVKCEDKEIGGKRAENGKKWEERLFAKKSVGSRSPFIMSGV